MQSVKVPGPALTGQQTTLGSGAANGQQSLVC